IAGFVRVFDPVPGVFDGAESGVDAEIGLDLEALAIGEEVVGPEAVALHRPPGVIAPSRALVAGPDAILPVVAGGKVASRPAQERHPEPARRVHDVAAEAVSVRQRAPLLVYPAVDAAPQVLDEVAED